MFYYLCHRWMIKEKNQFCLEFLLIISLNGGRYHAHGENKNGRPPSGGRPRRQVDRADRVPFRVFGFRSTHPRNTYWLGARGFLPATQRYSKTTDEHKYKPIPVQTNSWRNLKLPVMSGERGQPSTAPLRHSLRPASSQRQPFRSIGGILSRGRYSRSHRQRRLVRFVAEHRRSWYLERQAE